MEEAVETVGNIAKSRFSKSAGMRSCVRTLDDANVTQREI